MAGSGLWNRDSPRESIANPWTPPLVFSLNVDKHLIYLGTQYVMKTTDGGLHWAQISPDLTGAAANRSPPPQRVA